MIFIILLVVTHIIYHIVMAYNHGPFFKAITYCYEIF